MNIGILGTGMVGKALATPLLAQGHHVVIGTRDPSKLAEWAATQTGNLHIDSNEAAAQHAEILINATNGQGSLAALEAAGAANFAGKILIDISNPLDFSKGMPPTLFVKDDDSLAEQIQKAFPEAKVVKTLNTLTADLMLAPEKLAGGDHTIFVSGNDADAKKAVTEFLGSFGWKDVLDLGDITTARGTEMYLPLWIRSWQALGNANFNIKVVR